MQLDSQFLPKIRQVTHGELTSPKLIRKKCETCDTVIVLKDKQKKRFCRICLNGRTTIGVQKMWNKKHWANKKMKEMLRDIEEA